MLENLGISETFPAISEAAAWVVQGTLVYFVVTVDRGNKLFMRCRGNSLLGQTILHAGRVRVATPVRLAGPLLLVKK